MPSIVLRARATCQSCRSKLPPRSEAWVDEATGEVTCPTCHRLEEVAPASAPVEVAPVEVAAAPAPPTDPVPPLVAARRAAVEEGRPKVDRPAPRPPLPPRAGPRPTPTSSSRAPSGARPPRVREVRVAPSAARPARPAAPTAPPPGDEEAATDPAGAPGLPEAEGPASSAGGSRRTARNRRRTDAAETVEPAPTAKRPPRRSEPAPSPEVGAVPTPGRVRRKPHGSGPTAAANALLVATPSGPAPVPTIVPFDEVEPAHAPVSALPGPATPAAVAVRPVPADRLSPVAEVVQGPAPGAVFWDTPPDRLGAADAPGLGRPASPPAVDGPVAPSPHHLLDGVASADHQPAHSGLLLDRSSDARSPGEDVIDRGDMGEGRVGQTLEAARIHGVEVLHGLHLGPSAVPVDHLVIATNGIWVVQAVAELEGKLERRDLGDWFTSDQRLHVAGADRSDLIRTSHAQVDAVRRAVAASSFGDVEVQGVLCFGTALAGFVDEPFLFEGISVTWRRYLVEPMLTPVVLDRETRQALTRHLVESAQAAGRDAGADVA